MTSQPMQAAGNGTRVRSTYWWSPPRILRRALWRRLLFFGSVRGKEPVHTNVTRQNLQPRDAKRRRKQLCRLPTHAALTKHALLPNEETDHVHWARCHIICRFRSSRQSYIATAFVRAAAIPMEHYFAPSQPCDFSQSAARAGQVETAWGEGRSP